jgi:hypothetical protein
VSQGNQESLRGFVNGAVGSATPSAHVSVSGNPNGGENQATRLAQYTQQARFVSGRSFYQNGNQWIDASVQKLKDAKRVRVQFNSKDYFELAEKKPQVLPWLALGQNVQFALNGTVYEVYDADLLSPSKP